MNFFPSHSTSSPFSPTSHPSLCVYDPIRIAWNTSRINPTSVHLAFIVNREWDGYSTPLSLIPLPNTTIPINPIQCDLNEDHCVLNIKEVFVKDKKLYLEFDHPTNQPELLSTSRLNEALSMYPTITGTAIGVWSNPSLLEIIITEQYYQAILVSYSEGKIAVNLRSYAPPKSPLESPGLTQSLLPHVFSSPNGSPDQYSTFDASLNVWVGVVSLRLSRPGSYHLFMIHTETKQLISKIHRVKIDVNFLLRFLPSTNRFALRVTAESNPDLGSDSTLSLPMNSWFHLTFVFDNSSDAGYQMAVHLNGKLDIAITFPMKILPNHDPLHLFKDVSHSGARGFAADVIIWDSALTGPQVDRIYDPRWWSNSPLIRPIAVALEFLSSHKDSAKESVPLTSDPNLEEEYQAQEALEELAELQSQSETCSQQSDCQLRSWYDLLSPSIESASSSLSSDYHHLLLEIDDALTNCKPPATRLDLYAEGSVLGHIESLYKWSLLIGFGSEISSNPCGIEEEFSSFPQQYHQVVYSEEEKEGCSYLSEEIVSDQVKAVVGLMIAAQDGHSAAYIPLSTSISSSVGLALFSLDFRSSHGRCVLKKIVEFVPLPTSAPFLDGDSQDGPSEFIELVGGKVVNLKILHKFSEFFRKIDRTSATSASSSSFSPMKDPFNLPISASVLEMETLRPSSRPHNHFSLLSTGLLFMALDDHAEAFMLLARRYEHQLGGIGRDIEVAAVYAMHASVVASDSFHKIGGQPVLEGDRLNDETEKEVMVGNSGADDEFIQTLTIQANEGHVESMVSLGEINYYGSRGVARNQPRALELYNRAAETGNSNGLCGAGGMYLKREGTEKNITKALEMYNQAAKDGSIRALNGLGYIYFFGHGDDIPMNKTKAFHYFLTATEYDGDTDPGSMRDTVWSMALVRRKAATFYQTAAKKFGNFDAVVRLGNLHLQGSGVSRDAQDSLTYFNVANAVGPWAGWLRRGFNQYVQGRSAESAGNPFHRDHSGDYARALMAYLHSGEIGYKVSQSNSAFIIRRKLSAATLDKMMGMDLLLLPSPAPPHQSHLNLSHLSERLLVRQLLLSIHGGNSESAHLLGSYFLHTHPPHHPPATAAATLPTHEFPLTHLSALHPTRLQAALHWYSKSSAMGSSFGSFQCGLIHHFGILSNAPNLQRAERYYRLALEQSHKPHAGGGGASDGGRALKIFCEGMLRLVQYSERYSVARSVGTVIGWGLRWIFFGG